ncbi:MAG: siroheme synthase [Alphaproteobacteria bacterium]|nr:siroheme synthase [Alphaproteobacteria bacterium]
MIPVHLDPAFVQIALIGNGLVTLRRLRWLREGGADPRVFADDPSAALAQEAGLALRIGLPSDADLTFFQLIWIADLPETKASALAACARAFGRLVNVEDVNALCDFHSPAVVRRGALTLSAGTGGASPTAARAARGRLARAFDQDWESALTEISAARARLRAEGAAPAALKADAEERLRRRGLLEP